MGFQEEQASITLMAAQAMKFGHERLKERHDALASENIEQLMNDMEEVNADLREAQGALARDSLLEGTLNDDIEAEFAKLKGDVMGVPATKARLQDEFEATGVPAAGARLQNEFEIIDVPAAGARLQDEFEVEFARLAT